jgi:hypothetical protein
MSDTGTGSTPSKTSGQGWTASADGSTVSKTYKLGAPADAVKMAKRALQFAEKGGQAVRIDFSGSEVTIGLAATKGAVGDAQRKFAKRLDGGKGGDLPSKAPKDKATRKAAKAARAAKTTTTTESES